MDKEILNRQSQHWESNFSSKPEMFGLDPSTAAKKALGIFSDNKVKNIVELGAGLGRDSLFFGENSLLVNSLDYSPSAISSINQKIKNKNLTKLINAKIFDIRKKLPFKDNSVDACFSHMLYCMALSNNELLSLNNEICRILKPKGINIYTARNTNDADYKQGIHRGEDLYENQGFIVHFFSKDKIENLTSGFKNIRIDEFEEGSFPRKLYFVVNRKL